MTHEYDDIINLPHHVSKTHPQMTMYQRAAQFAPFAALTGHGAAIRETARLTDRQIELDDDSIELLNRRLTVIREHLKDKPEITVTFFLADEKKSGGAYHSYTGNIKCIDDYEQKLIMTDGTKITIPSVLDIESVLFEEVCEQ